jgi:hypothetical protein
MTLNQLLRRNVAGSQIFDPLTKKLGIADYQYSGGGMDASGNPLELGIPDANKLAGLQGYAFDWRDTGPANTGTLTAYDPSGNLVGSYNQQDQSTASSMLEAAALAAAGFGGLGALGFGPLSGLLGGLGGTSAASGGLSAGAVDAAALGLDAGLSAGAAGGAGGLGGAGAITGGTGIGGTLGAAGGTTLGIAGSGMTAPVLGANAGLGAGLGTAGAAGAVGAGLGTAGAAGGGMLSTLASSPWAKLIPAAGQLLGTYTQAQSAKDAVRANAEQQQKALDLQQRMYEEGVARQRPFLQGGTEDYNRLRSLMSGGPGAAQQFLQMDPGYGFRLSEGLKAVDRQAAARGGLISGGALKASQRYGQDLASQEFGNAYNRLAGLAQIGPSSAGVMNQLGQNYASGAGNVYGQLGETGANAALTRGSAYAGGLNELSRLAGQYFGQRPGG